MMLLNLKIPNLLNYKHMNLKMVLYILDNGNTDLDMEKENNYGKMEASMKDIGEIIWLMERVD
jgi:hypothetical protein